MKMQNKICKPYKTSTPPGEYLSVDNTIGIPPRKIVAVED